MILNLKSTPPKQGFLGTLCLLICAALLPQFSQAQTAASVAAKTQAAIDEGSPPAWMKPDLPDDIQRDVENKARGVVEDLDLENKAKSSSIETLLTQHYERVWAWHQKVDDELDTAWAKWQEARDNTNGKKKDELKALTIMTEKIDPIYAEFEPQIQSLLDALHNEIGEDKTIHIMDKITYSPGAERTFNAYCAMIPEMAESEKSVLWNRMVQARRDSLAAWSGGEIIKIFKKYKIRNEFSINYFGYEYRKRYKAWASGEN